MAPKKAKKDNYTAKDIQVLEGLDPVRKRPGMYIGSTESRGLHHLLWEVFDNAIDEVMAGEAKNIEVRLHKDGSATVKDDGRGIPVDIHKQTKKSALETVLTTLHSGGKFGGEAYKVSGGLHGVGLSVVNALSKYLRVEVCKDGDVYMQEYSKGVPKAKVKKIGKRDGSGTTVNFLPDTEVFSETEFDRKQVIERFRQRAYLTKGVRIALADEREERTFYYGFRFDGGLRSFVDYLNEGGPKVIHDNIFYVHKEYENMDVEVALNYNEGMEIAELSFANGINTIDGGMHLTGFRAALTKSINDYAKNNNLFKKGQDNLTGDDVREGLTAVVSIKLRDPQFEGQTKGRLGNAEARTAVESVTSIALKDFMELNPNDAKSMVAKAALAAQARLAAKAAKDTVLRKGILDGLTLPGKLADCLPSTPVEEAELFLVGGDSAGGCFSGDTEVALTDGRNLSFKELVKEHLSGKQNYCYTVREDGSVGVAPITNPRITKRDAKVLEVVLDDGSSIVCTENHQFMQRDGSYKEASNLKATDSLMPLYRKMSEKGGRITIDGYEMIFDPRQQRWIFTHLLADQHNLRHRIYRENDGDHRHHKDFNKTNNNPDNLIRLTSQQHLDLHRKMAHKNLQRPDVLAKLRKLRGTPGFRRKMSEVMSTPEMREMLSQRAKKQWENQEYKEYMAGKFLKFYKNNAEYRRKNNITLNKSQEEYWGIQVNRKKQAERVKKYFEKYPEQRKLLSEIAIVQWQDEDLRKWRSEKTKEQWTDGFRIKRRKAYNRTYYLRAMNLLHELYGGSGKVDGTLYEKKRKQLNDRALLRFGTVKSRFFSNDDNRLRAAVEHHNHRVSSVNRLEDKIDVYDIEVPGTHNFALASGVFVHNSAKSARDRRTQAILPLRGKVLNAEKHRIDKILANKEMISLVVALGTAIADEFDISKLRYHKIIVMSDADVDGAHIRTLLLTLFFRYFPQIIEKGHLYIAEPPLYRVSKGKAFEYAYSEEQKDKLIAGMQGQGSASIQRYKGLGEMNADQLRDTTMDPEKRTMKVVTIENAKEADKIFDILMGGEVAPRKHFIQVHADSVKNLDV